MSGIFDVIGTPQERQERTMRKALEARRQAWFERMPPRFEYLGGGDLLLRHGRFYSGRELPEQYQPLKGVPGACFENALRACQADPALRYVEGVYAIGAGHFTPHAWCLDPDGELLEVSLTTAKEAIAAGIELTTGQPILPLDRWGYWGAIFHPEYVAAVWELQDGVGILDRPSHDALGGNPNVSEWREDWHVLHHVYDPERRTP